MAELTAGARAAERLLEEKETLARSVTEALYRNDATLLDRYGPVGRERCLEDMRYNLEHLAPAVGLDRPEMFANYVRWLSDLLRVRNVATEDIDRSLRLIGDEVDQRFPADEAGSIVRCLEAGLAVLTGRGAVG